MATAKFTVKKYGALEVNQAAFRRNDHVISQTPLASAFTASTPCENGMWVNADKAAGVIGLPAASGNVYGIVFTTEKDSSGYVLGLNEYKAVAGDYPRVGLIHDGDTFTTNTFEYDTTDFADEAALKTALAPATLLSAPVYVAPQTGKGRVVLVDTKPASGAYGKVICATTMPNGEYAIKYQVIAL